MHTKATLGLTAGALALGLLAGLALGGNGDKKTARAAGPGPTRTVDGVPTGFERSKEGAAAAASSYSRMISVLPLEEGSQRQLRLSRIATTAGLDALKRRADEALKVIDAGLGLPGTKSDVVIRTASLGYKVKAYSSSAAEVEVWSVDVLGKTGSLAPQAGWGVSTFSLAWEDGDWKLREFPPQVPGPSPALQGTASSIHDLSRIRELEEPPNGPSS